MTAALLLILIALALLTLRHAALRHALGTVPTSAPRAHIPRLRPTRRL